MRQNRTEAAPHLRAGRRAEVLAERHLRDRGLRTIARNFHCRSGELDLIMRDGRQLVVVETRYRRRIVPVKPAESITVAKRKRIARAAESFLQRHPEYRDHAVRFDVVAVSGPLENPCVEWLRSAFEGGERD